MSDKNNNARGTAESQKNIYRQKTDMAMAGTDTVKKRRSAIAIMGSLIGGYFSAYNWNQGSMISIVLLAIICVATLFTNKFTDGEEAADRGAVL